MNFFTDLCFILTVFKHKYLKNQSTHEAQYTFRMFCCEERPFNRKESVTFYFARDIGEKCGNKQNHPVKKIIHYLLENALTDFFF